MKITRLLVQGAPGIAWTRVNCSLARIMGTLKENVKEGDTDFTISKSRQLS